MTFFIGEEIIFLLMQSNFEPFIFGVSGVGILEIEEILLI